MAAEPARVIHSSLVRATHWINVFAMVCMVGSGWRIYNASPFLPFTFPAKLTLGDWLGGALAIHFAAMWLLAGNFAVYAVWSWRSGHFRRRFLPVRAHDIGADIVRAVTFRLPHANGNYNAVQKLLYLLAMAGVAGAIVSGVTLWKPVQFRPLEFAMGGYDTVRRVHFAAMSGIVLFALIHVAMVAVVPSTLRPMLTGGAPTRRGG
jgi:thiosulfate reductase cytochrome b subunit